MERVRADQDRARALWRYTGDERPPFAEAPAPGQESVWDYPRPPRVEATTDRIRINITNGLNGYSHLAVVEAWGY